MKSNTFMAIMFTLGFGTYFGIQGSQRTAGTQPFSTTDELRVAMDKDAGAMAKLMRESLGADISISEPAVNTKAREIAFDIKLNNIAPTPVGKMIVPGLAKNMRDQGCPSYLQTVMALNGVAFVYELKFNDGEQFGAIRIDPESCVNRSES